MRTTKKWVSIVVGGALVVSGGLVVSGAQAVQTDGDAGSSLLTKRDKGEGKGVTNGFELSPSTWEKLETTSQSHPYGGDEWNANPTNLASHAYIEEEYLVSGAARVYDTVPYSDYGLESDSSFEYTTRAIVRRPAKLNKWSGDVVVEYMNASDGFGAMINWPRLAPEILDSGDAYVAFVGKPNAFPILQQFDPERYATLAMPNPASVEEQSCGLLPGDEGYTQEYNQDGLLWDMLSGIGLALDSGASPLERPAQRIYAVGESQSGSALYQYYTWFGGDRTTYLGEPVFDGYLAETGRPFNWPLNQCGSPLPNDDPQVNFAEMPQRGAPFFAINSEWDSPEVPPAPSSEYRLWSITGADHVDTNLMEGMWPIRPDLASSRAAGPDAFPWQVEYGATFELFSPAGWFCDDTSGPEVGLPEAEAQAFRLLKKWAKTGQEPPVAPYLERDENGEILKDADGNSLGGLRLPYIQAPIAGYVGGFWGDCAELHVPFSAERLTELYGSQEGYVRAVREAAEQSVRDGYLSRSDADAMVVAAKDRPIP